MVQSADTIGNRHSLCLWFRVALATIDKDLREMGRYPLEFGAGIIQAFLIMAVVVFSSITFTPSLRQATDEKSLVSGVLVHGYVLFIFLTEIIWKMGYSIQKDRRQGTLEQLYLAPAPVSAALFSRIAITVASTCGICVLSLLVLVGLIGSLPLFNLAGGAVILLLTVSGFCGLGLIFTALSFWLKEAIQIVSTAAQFSFILLCAPFFPFSALPNAIRAMAQFVPFSYCVDAYRSTLLGYPRGYPELAGVGQEFLVVLLCGILLPVIGIKLNHIAQNQARRAGNLSSY